MLISGSQPGSPSVRALPFFFLRFELGGFLHQFLALGFEVGFLFEKALTFSPSGVLTPFVRRKEFTKLRSAQARLKCCITPPVTTIVQFRGKIDGCLW